MKILIFSLLMCSCGSAIDALQNSSTPTTTPSPTPTAASTLCATNYQINAMWDPYDKTVFATSCNNAIVNDYGEYFSSRYCLCMTACLSNNFMPYEMEANAPLVIDTLVTNYRDRCIAYGQKTYNLEVQYE